MADDTTRDEDVTDVLPEDLNAAEYEVLSVFEANEIRKNRYPFEWEGRKFAIDMFLGDLFGLVLAEVSFESEAELESFPMPPFAIADVTNNELFTGGKLCDLSFEDIRDEIKRSGTLAGAGNRAGRK